MLLLPLLSLISVFKIGIFPISRVPEIILKETGSERENGLVSRVEQELLSRSDEFHFGILPTRTKSKCNEMMQTSP